MRRFNKPDFILCGIGCAFSVSAGAIACWMLSPQMELEWVRLLGPGCLDDVRIGWYSFMMVGQVIALGFYTIALVDICCWTRSSGSYTALSQQGMGIAEVQIQVDGSAIALRQGKQPDLRSSGHHQPFN